MKVTILGCSGSMTGPHSPASSYLVTAPHEGRDFSIVLDLGNGALGTLQRLMHPQDLDGVVLSHLHPDHMLDMCGLYVASKYNPYRRRDAKLPVYGPPGTHERMDAVYGPDTTSTAAYFDYREVSDGATFQLGPFTITAHRVYHPIEAYGLRVEAGGRVLAYSGDTDICDALTPLMAGAHLVLADCAYQDGRDDAIEGVHMSGSKCALAAMTAGGVERLVLTHLAPWNNPEICVADAKKHWPFEVGLAAMGETYEV